MKATMSQDGKLRFTIRVTHRVGIAETAYAMIYVALDEEFPRCAIDKMSRTDAERALRDELAHRGDRLANIYDTISEEERTQIIALARARAAELFPELAPAGRE